MFKGITIGQYLPGESLLHRLDPRMKIILIIIFLITLFLVNTFVGYGVLALFIVFLILGNKLPIKLILKGLRPIFFIISFTFILHSLMTSGGETLFEIGPIPIETEGVYTGAFMAVRLVLLVMTTSLLTLTTSPIALTDAIEHLLSPFKRIGVPAHELAMMMTIALRFIPTLMEETEKIMKAQKARGADFESGNIFERAKNLVPLLVPLFISAFRRADELALAMEARCYRGGTGRTRLKQLQAALRDYLALGFVLLLMIFIILLGI
ncbi:energy-coupling factor transporter transmembrane component T family protein [Natranaerobius trueperi]|uniref:Energy-coupling factor transporter transmembrane protein EcfT n=1 Tax=Natranaerobius trueperi TaxID=759412 RepID=A0A226BZI5_9FIRM|nr:energy-coupling factor transporter transmembrane protein EcfT [Natranaerobius trueperi]OWZ84458.1 transporter [Natranaerobius trueperi]